ncbi:MAG TPA: hypothetical protein VD741_08100 [Solirubrobacterales bacterium]|nr:hypothetical protein [Solirubrobacterales bacterium]
MSFLALVPRADAATVVNGDFETGTLSGWETFDEGSGEWTTYSGSNPFELPLSAPPQGSFAGATVQDEAGLHILYQEVDLGTGPEEVLRLYAYYASDVPLTTPESGTLSPNSPDSNQQYRIDVMDPAAPINSVDPEDILAPVFATDDGDPETMAPELISVDLTEFGGQTVGLRMAEVDNEGFFNAAVDAVAIGPPPPLPPSPPSTPLKPAQPPAPSNAFSFGKLKLNKKNGTATLKVNVPGAGTLTAVDAKRKAPKRIRNAAATTTAAGVATLTLKPTGAAKKTLKEKGKLKLKALVTFAPAGGTAATQERVLTLKLKRAP